MGDKDLKTRGKILEAGGKILKTRSKIAPVLIETRFIASFFVDVFWGDKADFPEKWLSISGKSACVLCLKKKCF